MGVLKYIPDFLLPKYKAKILDTISLNKKTIGYIMGNNLKKIDFNDEKEIGNFVANIKGVCCKYISTIYIEDCDRFNRELINELETKLGYKFPTGDKIKVYNIQILLRKISKLLNRELHTNDVLIICSDKSRLVKIIKALPKEVNCIANIGVIEDNLYEDILEKTGVSVYEPYKIEKAIKNFHIIINYDEETLFDINKIRNQGIVLDFSNNRSLKGTVKLNKNIIYIEDFNFPSRLESKWIDTFISSKLYEAIHCDEVEKYKQVYTKDQYWYLDEYIETKIKKRGRL